ncbi:nuclease (SNase domain protein) [Psychromonas ingrahamii 37]|uniref:Nuclease (SNase domain protein) n=1 Tax=Psychromonas ingrahamii (strain DSM 17664 / CCUG 51855 / 37) TaxID=357804 RepID=A1SXS3_PSYIN|nr:nuclease (SNase domain protein) [Psychromonas ingrahamii 37]
MKKLLLFVLLITPLSLFAKPKNYGSVLVVEVTSIYDADTFRVNINDWPSLIGENVRIRVNGVDAPEIRGKCDSEKKGARLAKQFTVGKLRNAKTIELRNMQRGKYFRILADVYVDGKNLTELLITAKLARPYDGGKRKGWCDNSSPVN